MPIDAVLNTYAAAYSAINHVVKLGHRRIAYVHHSASGWATSCLAAYQNACRDTGLESDPQLIVQAGFNIEEAAPPCTNSCTSIASPPLDSATP